VSKPPNHRGSDFIPPYPAGTAPAGKLHDRPRMPFELGLAVTAGPPYRLGLGPSSGDELPGLFFFGGPAAGRADRAAGPISYARPRRP
jgi:hypothetical protein